MKTLPGARGCLALRRLALAGLLVTVASAAVPFTAYATAPANAHLRFRVPSTLTQPDSSSGSGTVPGYLYWTTGKSSTPDVSCCTNTITSLGSFGQGGITTESQFPIPLRLGGDCFSYEVSAKDGKGVFVGSVLSDPTLGCEDGYIEDFGGSANQFAGSGWIATSDPSNYGGIAESSSTAGDSFTYQAFGSAVAWVAITGPNHGSAKVYIDGAYLTTVSTYSKTLRYRQVIWTTRWGLPLAAHTVKIVNMATAGRPRITVDAVAYLGDD